MMRSCFYSSDVKAMICSDSVAVSKKAAKAEARKSVSWADASGEGKLREERLIEASGKMRLLFVFVVDFVIFKLVFNLFNVKCTQIYNSIADA